MHSSISINSSAQESLYWGISLLDKIGTDLDANIFPVVYDDGIVEPGRFQSRVQEPGEEKFYERERERGSATRSGQRAAGRSWSSEGPSTGRSRAADTAASFLGKLNEVVLTDLLGVAGAYHQVKLWAAPDSVWLWNLVTPIRGLNDSAILITAYPLDVRYDVTSWAWWGDGFWIGPRHTNFVGGSVCAYEVKDQIWERGQELTKLLDLQVLWIVRHIYLREFRRWPGRQALHTAHERLNDHLPGELCGGCDSGRKYEQCCRKRDEMNEPRKRRAEAPNITERKPPISVAEFLFGYRKTPPSMSELGKYIGGL